MIKDVEILAYKNSNTLCVDRFLMKWNKKFATIYYVFNLINKS